MARPTALLIAGGADYHNTPEHYELLAGLLAGPAGLNVTVTDDLLGQTEASLSAYDLLVLSATIGQPPAAPVQALFSTVRRGTPLLGLHAAPFTVRQVEGGPEAIGSMYLGAHLPYQEFTVHILDRTHPITAGVEDFRIQDEPYRLDILGDGVQVLAAYDGRATDAEFKGERRPAHDEAHAWRLQRPRAPLVYVKQLGAGRICVNALGHDRAALTHPAFRRLVAQAAQWLLS
jgi:type 1 glutamine amidotransferase